MATGKFTIDGSPSSSPGVVVVGGETLDLQLEDQPALDVLSCVYQVERYTVGAPAITIPASGIASPPSAIVVATVPASAGDAHSWLIACTAVVTDTNGEPKTVRTKRLVAMLSTLGLRKMVAGESTEFDATDGWVEVVNDTVDAVAGVLAGVPPNIVNNVSITGPGAIAITSAGANPLALSSPTGNVTAIGGADFYAEGAAGAATVLGATKAVIGVTDTAGVVWVGTAQDDGEAADEVRIGATGTDLIALVSDALTWNGSPISGGGPTLTDATPTTYGLAAGSITETGLINYTISPSGDWNVTAGGGFGVTSGGEVNIGGAFTTAINLGNEDMPGPTSLTGGTAVEVRGVVSASISGAQARLDIDTAGAGVGRFRLYDTGGDLAATILADNAASSITAVGPLAITAPGISLTSPARTTNVAPPSVTLRGSDASATSTGANEKGGDVVLHPGIGETFDAHDWGRTVICTGQNNPEDVIFAKGHPSYLTYPYLTVGAFFSGNYGFGMASKVAGLSLTSVSTLNLTATSETNANSGGTFNIGTPAGVAVQMGPAGSAYDRLRFRSPAAASCPDAATTTIATIAITGAKAGSKPTRVKAVVCAYDAAGNATTAELSWSMRSDGANGVIVGTPLIDVGSSHAAEIAGLTFTVVNDAAGVRPTCANASGVAVLVNLTELEYS